MGIEFEVKFSATPEILSVLKEKAEGTTRHYHMQTTYYDTPDGALSARHWTLRCRKENEKSVCTLKYPAGDAGRGEAELECDSIETAIPALCKLSGLEELAALTEQGVVAVCGADFHRVAKTFAFQGTVMELALDEGKLMGGSKEVPLYEVEVELKEGEAKAVQTYAAILAAAYGLTIEPASKFRRALDLKESDHV